MIEAASGPGTLIWLASYPKSGNTWMRILLTNYLRESDEPADINELDGGPIASARSVFDDNVGVEASDLTQDEIERLRPLVYESMSDEIARVRLEEPEHAHKPVFLKVHDAYTRTPQGRPLISKAATAGVVYLVRNPLDVVESFAHHSAQTVELAAERMSDPSYCFVDDPHRLHVQLRQRLLSWSDHVTSWLDEAELPVLIVRYEDMKADTESALGKVLRFVGLEPEPDRLATAVEFSQFDRLQKQESDEGFGERMPKAASFFRTGEAGSWRETLAPELAWRICREHREVMDRLGYSPDAVVEDLLARGQIDSVATPEPTGQRKPTT